MDAINCPGGVFAVLGNHDTHCMVPQFEELGVQVLTNESAILEVNGHPLVLSGTDDVNNFYTDGAVNTLVEAPDGVKIALVHSPELAGVAADNGFDLYLCGHTHGGQISLPGGRPILTHLHRHRDLAHGFWSMKDMRGYTSPGVGTSGMPIRFFTRPEITYLTLRASKSVNGGPIRDRRAA